MAAAVASMPIAEPQPQRQQQQQQRADSSSAAGTSWLWPSAVVPRLRRSHSQHQHRARSSSRSSASSSAPPPPPPAGSAAAPDDALTTSSRRTTTSAARLAGVLRLRLRLRGEQQEKKRRWRASSTAAATRLEEQVPASSGEQAHHYLETFEELATWRRENAFLRTGYRRELGSHALCLRSALAYVHNETVNIHTHVFGALVAAVCLGSLALRARQVDEHSNLSSDWPILHPFATTTTTTRGLITSGDVWACSIFYGGAMTCFGLSALFHTFLCHSEHVAHRWLRRDFGGIAVLVWATNVPAVWFGLERLPRLRAIYWTSISCTALAAVYAVTALHSKGPHTRTIRTSIFALLAFSGVSAALHRALATWSSTGACLPCALREAKDAFALDWFALGGVAYALGALALVSRWPEAWSRTRGRCDIYASSHQLFHCATLVGVSLHAIALNKAFLHALSQRALGAVVVVDSTP